MWMDRQDRAHYSFYACSLCALCSKTATILCTAQLRYSVKHNWNTFNWMLPLSCSSSTVCEADWHSQAITDCASCTFRPALGNLSVHISAPNFLPSRARIISLAIRIQPSASLRKKLVLLPFLISSWSDIQKWGKNCV